MKLDTLFKKASVHADSALVMYDFLASMNRTKIRSEFRNKFYESRLRNWPESAGFERLEGKKFLLVGTSAALKDFILKQQECKESLLRSAVALSMSAFDKMMHELVLKNFAVLCREETLDDILAFPISTAYDVATTSQQRRGKGGKVKIRPATKLKSSAINILYKETLLGSRKVQQILKGLGHSDIWAQWGKTLIPAVKAEEAKNIWNNIYNRRNWIVHEADASRQLKNRSHKSHPLPHAEAVRIVETINSLAAFIAKKVD